MKHPFKRVLSAVLVVLLCVSLLSGLSIAATVNYLHIDYQTGNPDGFQDVILNWGQRGTDATFLSPNAIDFYEDNNITYDALAQLAGNSNVSATPNSALYKTLKTLMTNNHKVITSYADTRPLYSYTDCQDSDRNNLTCFYSGIKIGPNWDSGATWNREHTWPNSKGMDGSDEDDIMMLRPASSSVNSSRGNNAYGESQGYYDPNKVSGGTLNLHGDVARIFLYIYVRWGNTANPWGTEGVIENKDVLLRWMAEDPVDTWEMGRNDSVESITGTRNVFIDYPELAFALFDEELPTDMITPSGEAFDSGNPYAITVLSNNTLWGNAARSGKVINTAPAEGYRVAGYTLLSGNASLEPKGIGFALTPTSDCTVRIDFEERSGNRIRFVENGTEVSSKNVFAGDTYLLPQHSTTVPDGYNFQGWVTAELTETSTKPAVSAAGKVCTSTDDVTYYALYSRVDAAGTGNSSSFEQFSGELVAGRYLITYDDGALTASVSKDRMDITAVAPIGNTVDDPAATIIWDIAFTDDGYVTLYNKETASYAAGTGVKNKAKLLTSVTDYAKWTPSGDSTYEFVNLGNESKGVNKHLRRNSDFGFACYATSTGGALTLYKQSGGTVYYCTTAAACEHTSTRVEAATKASCTENGYTEGVYCEDCHSYISGHEVVLATGHTYEADVTPPVGEEPGVTVYVCTVCGDRTDPDVVYLVSFVTPAGVPPIGDIICGQNGITLPDAGVPAGDRQYRFVGWTDRPVSATTATPPVVSTHYVATQNIRLYALYSYTEGASDITGWNLVNDAADLSVGDTVVLAANQKGKVAADIYSQYLTETDAQFSADLSSITQLPETAIKFTLGKNEEGFWTLNNQAGQPLCSSALKKVNWDRGTNGWTISIDEDSLATVCNANADYGYFLYNINSPRFCTYVSSPNTSMLMPQLYKLDGSLGTTYYTSEIAAPDRFTVSGSVTTGTEGDGTIELLNGEEVVATASASGNYTLSNVPAGTYTLRVSKKNHVTREYTVTVTAGDVVLDVKIHLIGDIDGNGKINVGDAGKVYSHMKKKAIITDEYMLLCADVSGDGRINVGDVGRIYSHIKSASSLWE